MVRCGDKPVRLGEKHTALLLRLAAEHPGRVRRSVLSRQLWSTKAEASARHNLSQAVYQIKQRLGPSAICGDDASIWLGDVDSDVAIFRAAIDNSDVETAAATYQGTLAEGFGVAGQVEFEQWLDVEREAVKRQAIGLLEEPLPTGLRSGLESVLCGDIPPRPGTYPEAAVHGSARSEISFVGRVEYLQGLTDVWSQVEQGHGRVAIVEGEAGIGKSALCNRYFRKTILRGASGVQGSGYELEQHLAYGLVVQLLTEMQESGWLESLARPWVDILRQVYPSLTPSDQAIGSVPPAPAHRLALALSRVIANQAESGPVSIFVDDIQWVDPISVGILHYLQRAAVDLPLFVLLARRRVPTPAPLDVSWSDAVRIQLRGLSPKETEYLLKRYSEPMSTTHDVERIQRLSQGNPLLIKALIQAGANAQSHSLPPTVFRYFQAQAERLPAEALVVGSALAAIGDPVDVSGLLYVTQLPEAVANTALQELIDRDFIYLDPSEGRFAFHHDLVAEVFLSALAPAARAALHGRAGRLLTDQGRSPAIVATQFAIAGTHTEAFQTALKAATASAELHAYSEAEHFFRIAAAHAPGAAEMARAKSDLAELLVLQNRAAEAEDLLSELIHDEELAGPDAAEVKLRHLIASLKSTVRTGDYLTAALEQTRSTEGCVAPLLTVRAYTGLTANALEAGRADIARRALNQAGRVLETLDESPDKTSQEVTALALAALLEPDGNALHQVDALLGRVRHSPAAQVHGLLARGVISFMHGNMENAESDFVRSIGICESFGLFDQRLAVASNLGVCYMEQGRWDEAEAQFSMALKAAEIAPRREIQSTLWNMAILEYERGQFDRAIGFGRRCLDLGDGRGSEKARIGGLAIIGLAQLELGRLSGARSCEQQIRLLIRDGIRWSNDVSYIQIFLARMTAIGGDRSRAARELKEHSNNSLHFDYYCDARIEVELLRLAAAGGSAGMLRAAEQLRPKLAKAKAVPLVDRIDSLIARARSTME